MNNVGSLCHLDPLPIYFLPDDDFVDNVLIEALRRADAFDCMVGYFDSGALADLAPGLASYLARAAASMRLVISPNVSEADFIALSEGVTKPEELLERRLLGVLGSKDLTENALAMHTLLCLAYLLSRRSISIKVALVPGGLFHPKIWLFTAAGDVLAAHGSSNLTAAGIGKNVEQIAVARSWGPARESEVARELVDFFATTWSERRSSRYPEATVFDLPDAVRRELLKVAPRTPPTEDDFERLRMPRRSMRATREGAVGLELPILRVPAGIVLDAGPFAHQGEAIGAWEAAHRRGILAMATGSGKTITALAATTRLSQASTRGLLVAVAAPFRPLVSMWGDEARSFGAAPIDLANGSARSKLRDAEAAVRRLDLRASQVEILVMTHDALVDERFQAVFAAATSPRLLIADEVHRLGRPEFLERRPEFFEYRLGLSATPKRQYDPEGTEALEGFFGPQVFEFGLDRAIGVCLVPFDYFVHVVQLENDELAAWRQLTEKILRLMRYSDGDDQDAEDQLRRLFIRRRRILEVARQKLPALDRELAARGGAVSATLVYASDKAPTQLQQIHTVLRARGLKFHQVTAEETAVGRLAERILDDFSKGLLQVLTAKRVLDEGINVPGIRSAYVLASTTVERQWVQRLGRVLRLDPKSGKTHAEYHDFVALPAPEDGRDDDARRMIKGELERLRFFGQHARNAVDSNGWLTTVNDITATYFA